MAIDAYEIPMTKQEADDLALRCGDGFMPLISEIPAVQAHYEQCRLNGTSHVLSEMFAWQIPPSCMTDSVFCEGRVNGNQFEGAEWIGNRYRELAVAEGVDTTGARYLHSLADFPGDPKAWVRTRGDVQRVCEERGWGCQGAVNVKARAANEPEVNTPVAPDIVESCVQQEIERNPGLAFLPKEEVTEQVTEKLRPQWTRKKMPKRQLDLAA